MKKLWRAAWFKDILKDALLCFAVLSTQDIVWKIPNGVFFMSISGRKKSDHDPSERKEEALWNKKQKYGSVIF